MKRSADVPVQPPSGLRVVSSALPHYVHQGVHGTLFKKGDTRHCMKCSTWRPIGPGWKRRPVLGFVCPSCLAGKAQA